MYKSFCRDVLGKPLPQKEKRFFSALKATLEQSTEYNWSMYNTYLESCFYKKCHLSCIC